MAELYEVCPLCQGERMTSAFGDVRDCPGCQATGFVKAGLTHGQFDLYRRRLAQGANYVVDREQSPQCVLFQNGRKVWIRKEGETPYLEVDWSSGTKQYEHESVLRLDLPADGAEPTPVYRVFSDGCGRFVAWRKSGGTITRVGDTYHEVSDAYEAVMKDLNFVCPVDYRDIDECEEFWSHGPQPSDF